MPELNPVAALDVESQLAEHLQPEETVLWQGRPRPSTFFPPVMAGLAIVLVIAGLAILSGAIDHFAPILDDIGSLPEKGASIALIAMGAFILAVGRMRRGANWIYAISDRRLLSVCGARLVRSVEPGDISRFGVNRDAAYWHYVVPRAYGGQRTREARYPGFHGLDDPGDMKRTLEDWLEAFSRKAGQSAAAFVTAQGSEREVLPDGILQVRHPRTGLTIDVPKDWETVIRLDNDGPLRFFGITLLSRVIRPGQERSYAEGADWNTLIVRGAPDSGFTMIIRNLPLSMTLEGVLNDPWAKRANLQVLKTTPELNIGGFRGFSVVRQMPAGAQLMSFGAVAAPVATRQAWLAQGERHVEIIGMARLDQPDVQRAVDAMIQSVRIT